MAKAGVLLSFSPDQAPLEQLLAAMGPPVLVDPMDMGSSHRRLQPSNGIWRAHVGESLRLVVHALPEPIYFELLRQLHDFRQFIALRVVSRQVFLVLLKELFRIVRQNKVGPRWMPAPLRLQRRAELARRLRTDLVLPFRRRRVLRARGPLLQVLPLLCGTGVPRIEGVVASRAQLFFLPCRALQDLVLRVPLGGSFFPRVGANVPPRGHVTQVASFGIQGIDSRCLHLRVAGGLDAGRQLRQVGFVHRDACVLPGATAAELRRAFLSQFQVV